VVVVIGLATTAPAAPAVAATSGLAAVVVVVVVTPNVVCVLPLPVCSWAKMVAVAVPTLLKPSRKVSASFSAWVKLIPRGCVLPSVFASRSRLSAWENRRPTYCCTVKP
jgi:hypothetical protein